GVLGDQLARAGHVAADLLDQRLGVLEAALAAQAREELEAQIAPVEVAVEVEDVGLDQLTAAGLEGRTHADADSCRAPVGQAGVDAVPGAHERLVRHEVGRGEAQLAAASVSADDLPPHLEGAAEQPVRLGHLAGEDEAANVAGGDDLAVDLEQRMHDGSEARVGRQQPRVTLSLVAEAKVLTDRHPAGAERTYEYVVDELGGRALRELGVEGDHDQLPPPELGQQLGLARERGQQLGSVLRRNDRHGVRLEGEHAVRAVDDLAMAEVHAVEGPHCDAARCAALDVGQAGDDHPRKAYWSESRASSSARSNPINGGSFHGAPRGGGGEASPT